VDAEDLLIHNGSKGQAVEDVAEDAPELDVVAALALVVEPVDARDAVALVVPAEQEEVLRVLHRAPGSHALRFKLLRQAEACHSAVTPGP